MLGKGLESLIPQKRNQNAGAPIGHSDSASPVAQKPIVQKKETPMVTFPNRIGSAPHRPAHHVGDGSREKPAAPAASAHKKTETIAESVFHIELERIKPNPDQPRRHFNDEALRDLANSIREFGFLQPIVVSKIEKETPTGIAVEYEVIAGERRFMAAKLLGLNTIPAIVRNVSLEREKLELAVIENIQRENLNPIETARAFQRLQEEFRMTQREIAAKLGKSREVVANTVRLLDLPAYIQEGVQTGKLSESNARVLIGIDDPGAQKRLFDEAIANKLTTREVRIRASETAGHRRGRPPLSEQHLPPEMQAVQDELSSSLGAPVEIRKNAENGKIMITFYSEEELANILKKLGREEF